MSKKLKNMTTTNTNPITSLGTGLIPFIEHNDANRTLMGSNMQRQALPLLQKEIAQISTGIETQIIKSSHYTTIAKNSGVIKFTNTNELIVKRFVKTIKTNQNKSRLIKYRSKIKEKNIKKLPYQIDKYILQEVRKSNQNNYIKYENLLNKNEWVKKGQIINEGNGTRRGKLALGRNILLGYMSWEGYNFEDAVVINRNLVDKDTFTSITTKKEKLFLIKNEKEEVRII